MAHLCKRTDLRDPTLPDGTLVTRIDIANYFGVSAVAVDRWVRDGILPQRVTPKGIPPRWRVGDVRSILNFNTGSMEKVWNDQTAESKSSS